MFKKFHIRYTEVSMDIFNKHLDYTKEWKTIFGSYEEWSDLKVTTQRYTRWLKLNRLNQSLTYKIGDKWINIKTNISRDYGDIKEIRNADPTLAYSIFAKIVKPIDYSEYHINNLGGYQNNHPDKKGHYDYAICYDVNKSFFNACNNLMPTEMLREVSNPEEGEVGFLLSGTPVIGPSDKLCAFVFRLERHKGLDRYVDIYKKKFDMVKTSEEKQYLKDQINMSIGNLANHNPFLRNMIVWYSNQFIESKVDENTIWSNTDSIVSTVRRPDLEVGKEIGKFKIQHEGEFIQAVTGYQWISDKCFSNKGISIDQIKLYEKVKGKPFILGKTDVGELADMVLWRFNYEKETFEKIKY